MMTDDKAKQTAEALMKPLTNELRERQERLEERKRSNPKPFSSLAPATVAAIATAASMSLLSIAPVYAAVFGLVAGWTIGPLLLGRD
jgi:predicted benzoate:H+ symporter BenE